MGASHSRSLAQRGLSPRGQSLNAASSGGEISCSPARSTPGLTHHSRQYASRPVPLLGLHASLSIMQHMQHGGGVSPLSWLHRTTVLPHEVMTTSSLGSPNLNPSIQATKRVLISPLCLETWLIPHFRATAACTDNLLDLLECSYISLFTALQTVPPRSPRLPRGKGA